MKGLAHSLMATGQPLADDELILYVLRGLGTECESVVVNLTSKDSVNLEEVQYLLQTHEMRLEHLSSETHLSVSIAEAHFASNSDSRTSHNPHTLFSNNIRDKSGRRGRGRFSSGG